MSNIKLSYRMENHIRTNIFKFIIRGFFIGIIFHFAQIAHSGYNGDTLGFGSYYSTYLGELAQGRFGLLAFSGRIVNSSIEFIGAIALYAIASWFVVEIAGMEINSLLALLVQAIFMSQPHMATYSTFSYASFPYTLAYFLMILAVWVIQIYVKVRNVNKKRSYILVFFSIVFVAASFSIWQAYIPTFTTLIFILILFGDREDRLCTIAIATVSAVGGTILYVIGMKIVNHIYGVIPTDARGFADVLSLNLPLFKHPITTIKDSYVIFLKFLLTDSVVYNGVKLAVVHGILGFCLVFTALFWLKGAKEKKELVVTFIVFALAPVAFCFYRIITEDVSKVPWTYLHSMIFIWILFLAMFNKVKIQKKMLCVIISLLIGFVICRQVYICNAIYQSVQDRDMKSTAMAISIYTRLSENEEWNSDVPVMVVGSMDEIYPDNNWYYLTTLKGWQPQINEFVPYPAMPQNWVVQINRIYGTQFIPVDYRWKNYEKVLASSEYLNMDIWPSNESMRIIDGVMVIKLGELE